MRVTSAHRTPDAMAEYGRTAAGRGLRVIIAGAGGAAHDPDLADRVEADRTAMQARVAEADAKVRQRYAGGTGFGFTG